MTSHLQVIIIAACICLTMAVAVAIDARGGAFEAEIGPKQLSVHQPQQAGSSRHRVARREETKDKAPPVELQQLREGAARQDGTMDGAMPYFVGSWNGYRNNWYGDVGVAFVPQRDFTITSLGRHHHNETGLLHTVPVTLWSVETELPLAIVNVGPHSFLEGHYHWEPIDEPGVAVSQGREYRLTQACTPNMQDKWFDRTVTFEEVEANSATGFARFVGAVNMSGFGFPSFTNGQFRRPGMVNFKIKPPPVHIGGSGARHSAEIQAAIVAVFLWSAFL